MSEDTRPKCPRCTRPMHDKMVRNSLSRLDNETYICNGCGRDEAIFNMFNPKDLLTPLDQMVFPGEKTRPDQIPDPKPLVIPASIADQIPAGTDIATLAETLGDEETIRKTYGEKIAEREAREVAAAYKDAGLFDPEHFE